MPKPSAMLAVVDLRARASRLFLVLAALVFLLNVADPTPRFLGIRRAAWFGQPTKDHVQVHRILPVFVLPPAVKPPTEGASASTADHYSEECATIAAPVASPPFVAARVLARPLSSRAPAPGRSASVSPLRC